MQQASKIALQSSFFLSLACPHLSYPRARSNIGVSNRLGHAVPAASPNDGQRSGQRQARADRDVDGVADTRHLGVLAAGAERRAPRLAATRQGAVRFISTFIPTYSRALHARTYTRSRTYPARLANEREPVVILLPCCFPMRVHSPPYALGVEPVRVIEPLGHPNGGDARGQALVLACARAQGG